MEYADRFAQALEEKFNAQEGRGEYRMTVMAGRKFDKIVMQTRYDTERPFTGGSVHAFVEKATGLLIKPAGWNAPAKWGNDWASKYDLSDPMEFDIAVQESHFAGGYLYAR
jgi:hypothetical protein